MSAASSSKRMTAGGRKEQAATMVYNGKEQIVPFLRHEAGTVGTSAQPIKRRPNSCLGMEAIECSMSKERGEVSL